MITHVSIKDFAIIENIDIEFFPGFNVITGETGSGKSIIIQAISLAFGARADSTSISTGKDKAKIQVVFENDSDTYILSREITSKGKSLCKINDDIVTVKTLYDFSKNFVDIHGQYDNQYLLHPESHIKILDDFGFESLSKLKTEMSLSYKNYVSIRKKLKALLDKQKTFQENSDFVKYQLKELDDIDPKLGEYEEISERINILKNAKLITDNLSECHNLISENPASVTDALASCIKLLDEAEKYQNNLSKMKNELSDCYYRLSDISSDLRKLTDTGSYNGNDLEAYIERHEMLKKLVNKYGSIENSIQKREEFRNNFNDNNASEKEIQALKNQLMIMQKELIENASNLSKERRSIADYLSEKINAELNQLGFKNVVFSIDFKTSEKTVYTENGMDNIEFMISTNLGENPKAVAKIASGGEISRIMLAFKSVLSYSDNVDSMIFDEIDTGISGNAANIVGKKLLKLSEKKQIICITHLPQIAAKGNEHYKIIKEVTENHTATNILRLNYEDRIDEIARFLGGENITSIARKNAEELLTSKQ